MFGKRPEICFIWIPKSAGNSIYEWLHVEVGMRKLPNPKEFRKFRNSGSVTFGHAHYLSLIDLGFVSAAYHARAFKFAVVRDPYDRVVSLYNYMSGRGVYAHDFDRFLDDVRLRRPPIGAYNYKWISPAAPQVQWLLDGNGEFVTNMLFGHDQLAALASEVRRRLGRPLKSSIGHLNASIGAVSAASSVLSNPARLEIINEVYAADFELLGYPMRRSHDAADDGA